MTHPDDPPSIPQGLDPSASLWVLVGMVGLMAAGFLAFSALKPRPGPPPPEIAADPLLVAGRKVYQARCVSCHGESGRGDGPIARSLSGPPPGDLTDGRWKHGDKPEDVLAVVARGVPGTAMSGWAAYLDEADVRAATAYVFHLAGAPVPDLLRK